MTRIHGAAGLIAGPAPLAVERPFRAPHHTASTAGLLGGGNPPRPGEISLAHRGVLFLDELPEFERRALESLRQVLEERRVVVSRAAHDLRLPGGFPARRRRESLPVRLAAAAASATAAATTARVARYRARLSGPLLDRIDLHVAVPAGALGRSSMARARGRAASRSASAWRPPAGASSRAGARRGFRLNADSPMAASTSCVAATPEARALLGRAVDGSASRRARRAGCCAWRARIADLAGEARVERARASPRRSSFRADPEGCGPRASGRARPKSTPGCRFSSPAGSRRTHAECHGALCQVSESIGFPVFCATRPIETLARFMLSCCCEGDRNTWVPPPSRPQSAPVSASRIPARCSSWCASSARSRTTSAKSSPPSSTCCAPAGAPVRQLPRRASRLRRRCATRRPASAAPALAGARSGGDGHGCGGMRCMRGPGGVRLRARRRARRSLRARKPRRRRASRSARKPAKARRARAPRRSRRGAPEPRARADRRRAREEASATSRSREFFAKNRHLLGFDNPVARRCSRPSRKASTTRSTPARRRASCPTSASRSARSPRRASASRSRTTARASCERRSRRSSAACSTARSSTACARAAASRASASAPPACTACSPPASRSRSSRARARRSRAHHFELVIDTKRNEPRVKRDETVRVGQRARHARRDRARGGLPRRPALGRRLHPPDLAREPARRRSPTCRRRPRSTAPSTSSRASPTSCRPRPREIKPHPHGVELGVLMQMFRDTKARNLSACLQADFSRVSSRTRGRDLRAREGRA